MSITAKTLPNSLITILGFDQSLTFMGAHNIITQVKLDEIMSPKFDDYKFELNGNHEKFASANAFLLSPTRKKKLVCSAFDEDILNDVPKSHVGISTEFQAPRIKPRESKTVRRFFPEVWINEVSETTTGEYVYRNSTPDSITSWMINGFSINKAGFAIAEPQKVSVFKDFFIKVEKPSSVKLSEIVNLKVIVYNYMSSEAITTVTFNNRDGQFNFMNGNNIENGFSKSMDIQVRSNDIAAINFRIRPKTTGKIYLNIQATTNTNAKDDIEESLEVEYFGKSMHQTKARMINLKDNNFFNETFVFENLSNAIENSISFEVTTSTDAIGPALNNVENLM